MKLEIESTNVIKETENGQKVRLWYGEDKNGLKVDVWVAGIMIPNATKEMEERFSRELEESEPLI